MNEIKRYHHQAKTWIPLWSRNTPRGCYLHRKCLSPGRHQAIIWTNARILLIGLLGTDLSEINRNSNIFVQENPFENVVWKKAAVFSRPQCENYIYENSNFNSILKPEVSKFVVIVQHYICNTLSFMFWFLELLRMLVYTEMVRIYITIPICTKNANYLFMATMFYNGSTDQMHLSPSPKLNEMSHIQRIYKTVAFGLYLEISKWFHNYVNSGRTRR